MMKYSEKFILNERRDGSEFYTIDNEELKELVHDIHYQIFELIPNDWIYETIFESFENFENGVDEVEPDIYNKDLMMWLNNSFARRYMDEVIREDLISLQKYDFIQHISIAQYLAKKEITLRVKEFIDSKK